MNGFKASLQALLFAALLTACATAPQEPVAAQTEAGTVAAAMPDLSEEGLNPRPLGEVEAVSGFDCPLSNNLKEAFDRELVNTTRPPGTDTSDHAPFGLPVPTVNVDNEILLHHKEYLVMYDTDLKVPVWVAYKLEKKNLVSRPRTNCFRPDPRLTEAQNPQLLDYTEPVFDRGHLVPRADMNRTEAAMLNTFVLTNMTPQHARFNQGLWGELETQVREMAYRNKKIYIVSGSVFDKNGDHVRDADADADRMQPFDNVAIPTHFYKVVLHQLDDGTIESVAVLVPNENTSMNKAERLAFLNSHRVSVDEIEAVSGYDLFPDLPDTVETAMEASVSTYEFQ